MALYQKQKIKTKCGNKTPLVNLVWRRGKKGGAGYLLTLYGCLLPVEKSSVFFYFIN